MQQTTNIFQTRLFLFLATSILLLFFYLVHLLTEQNILHPYILTYVYILYICFILVRISGERKSVRQFQMAYEAQWKTITDDIVQGKKEDTQKKNHILSVKKELQSVDKQIIRYRELFLIFSFFVLVNTYSVELTLGKGIDIPPLYIIAVYVLFFFYNKQIEKKVHKFIEELEKK